MKTVEYFTDWQLSRKFYLRQSTYEAEYIYFTRHIVPFFAAVAPELEDVSPVNVNDYVKLKLKTHSIASVKKHLHLIKQALNEAVLLGYLQYNPASPVRLPRACKAVSVKYVFLTANEAQFVLDALSDTDIYLPVALALYYGLRRSEVLGLKWQAIDFKRNTLTVQHTVVKNLTINAVDMTKTETSCRTFQILPELLPFLYNLKRTSAPMSDYLFCRADGTVMRPDTLTRTFQRELKKHNLPEMRFHDLRHSTASVLFDKGWNLEDVKNWLGHSDIETTSNIYLHYGRTRKILLAKDLEGMFKLKMKN